MDKLVVREDLPLIRSLWPRGERRNRTDKRTTESTRQKDTATRHAHAPTNSYTRCESACKQANNTEKKVHLFFQTSLCGRARVAHPSTTRPPTLPSWLCCQLSTREPGRRLSARVVRITRSLPHPARWAVPSHPRPLSLVPLSPGHPAPASWPPPKRPPPWAPRQLGAAGGRPGSGGLTSGGGTASRCWTCVAPRTSRLC